MQLRLISDTDDQLEMTIEHNTVPDAFIAANHYLQSTPYGAKVRMMFWIGKEPVGAMLWGRPTARALDQERILELTRMYFVDDTPKFTETKALAMARKHIRKHFPEVKGLLAYASTGEGHEGTIYLADNWFVVGRTSTSHSWDNRDGRTQRDSSVKLRFVRSS